MLISFLLDVADLLGKLLDGVLVRAVLHLKICAQFSACRLFTFRRLDETRTDPAASSQLLLVSPWLYVSVNAKM